MDIPLIRRFAMGYVAGAKYVNPKIAIAENYVGVTGEAWNNPPKAKELALSQYANGADVVVPQPAPLTQVFSTLLKTKRNWPLDVIQIKTGSNPALS